jgi:spore germination cell wall hydrolase CwlJ-like protein
MPLKLAVNSGTLNGQRPVNTSAAFRQRYQALLTAGITGEVCGQARATATVIMNPLLRLPAANSRADRQNTL